MVADVSHHFPAAHCSKRQRSTKAPVKFAIWRLSLTSNMTRRRRFAIKWSILTSVSWTFSALAKQNCLIEQYRLVISQLVERSAYSAFVNGEQAMIEALKTILGKCTEDAAPPDSVEVFCYSQHLRGDSHPRAATGCSECIEYVFPAPVRRPVASRRCGFRADVGLFFERECLGAKLENAIEFYGVSHNKLHGLSVQVETNR